MIPMKNYLFQTPEDICVQLKKMTHPVTIRTTDIANFWHYLESATLPVITKSTTTENREVTFLWRSEKALQGVYLRLNRVTDKKDVKKGLMTHIPSTDIWMLTLVLPASYRGSYSFIEIPTDGFAPIFPDICYHLTHYKPAAADIPVASDNPAHYADAIRYNARTPLQGSLLPLTRLVWA